MSYQQIRGLLESSTASVLAAAGLSDIFYDNVAHAQPDASATYAEISITFARVKADTIGCPGNDSISGTITAFIYAPANTGSATGEELSFEVLRAWSQIGFSAINSTSPFADTKVYLSNFDGPRSIANQDRLTIGDGAVHQLFVVTAAFTGRYTVT